MGSATKLKIALPRRNLGIILESNPIFFQDGVAFFKKSCIFVREKRRCLL